ncbi:MAG TPA: DUF2784 domain-containing protein [Ramlibacter sp.]|nr:DUF2784 domain-containing protein [Ramlibacter sp.]
MPWSLLADAVVVLHFAFVLFAVTGGFLALRWRWLPWLHLPVLGWALLMEFSGWICPLTPLEQRLRLLAGEGRYSGGFIEHYLLPLLYPPGLTPQTQWLLGGGLAAVNLFAYWLVWRTRPERRPLR